MPTTIEGHIEAALFARVATFVVSPALIVAWPNISSAPPARYLRVTHLPNRSVRLFLDGADPHRRMGLLQLSVFTEKNKGPTPATELAGQLAAHFAADLELSSGPVTVSVIKAPDVTGAIADDAHWHVPVTVQYETFS